MGDKKQPKELKTGKDTRSLIYDISVASYAFTISRIDAVNARMQTVLTIASTLAVAFAVIATNINEEGQASCDYLLYLTAVAYLMTLIGGIWTMLYGKPSALRPKTLRENYSEDAPDQFMDEIITDAGTSMDENLTIINRKHWMTVVASGFLGLQVILMGIWLMVSF